MSMHCLFCFKVTYIRVSSLSEFLSLEGRDVHFAAFLSIPSFAPAVQTVGARGSRGASAHNVRHAASRHGVNVPQRRRRCFAHAGSKEKQGIRIGKQFPGFLQWGKTKLTKLTKWSFEFQSGFVNILFALQWRKQEGCRRHSATTSRAGYRQRRRAQEKAQNQCCPKTQCVYSRSSLWHLPRQRQFTGPM